MTNEELVQRIQSGEDHLTEELWAQVEKFVYWRAKSFYDHYQNRCKSLCIEIDDLMQEGYIALVKAIEKYDAGRNARFLTAFGYYLKSAFFDCTQMHSTGWQNDMTKQCKSIYEPTGENMCLLDSLQTEDDTEKIVDALYREQAQKTMEVAFAVLTPTQRRTVQAIYFDCMTYEAAGRHFGCSKAGINSIVRGGLNKLRKDARVNALRG